jgi:predicted SAM-dependent methyltransferase
VSGAERYHLGCGPRPLAGWVNVDIQEAPGTDVAMDLTEVALPEASGEVVFSNAFFEHLRRDERVRHLRSVLRVLAPGGSVCYLGLPDFRAVAELYLSGGPGMEGPVFDLYEVYRYTHGEPEVVAPEAYYGQLHKSLFDTDEVRGLLTDAGFPSFTVFTYVYPGEPAAVTLGFFATREPRSADALERDARAFLAPFDGDFLETASLAFGDATRRSALAARAATLPERSGARRIARILAVRLWRRLR